MCLGIGGFKPTIGDLVKVLNEAYNPIAKGTIARITGVSETGDVYFIEGNDDVPLYIKDLELVAYRIGRYDITPRTSALRTEKPCS